MNALTATIPSASGSSDYLATRALIVSLNISHWTGHRLDRSITDEINDAKNADADAGRYNKKLLPKESLAGVSSVVNETRAEFARRTLPWVDKGGRIMSSEAYMAHTRWMNGQVRKFDAAVDAFLVAYPGYLLSAPQRLGDAYDPSDYPPADELRGKFSISMTTMPVPTSNDFRAQMSQAQADHIREQIEATVAERTSIAIRDVYQRIANVTERMVDRLNAYRPASKKGERSEGTFTFTLVENVRDLIDILPSLNITGDPLLAAMSDRMRPLVEWDADTLRADPGKRRDVAAEAQKIFDTVSDYLS